MASVKENLISIKQRITRSAEKVNRNPSDITLVAVTKTVPIERIKEAGILGVSMFGENRVQEAKTKIPYINNKIQWRLIGHLQTNKVRDAVNLFDYIDSVDSIRLAEKIEKRAAQINKVQKILLEVNISGEEVKYGIDPKDIYFLFERIADFKHIQIEGLMTVPPICENKEEVRPYFRKMYQLKKDLGLALVSMGMSQDFEIAIEEGSDMVRIGSALFGSRT
ncbi:MAG: YggS family pyridoxal phosphate-dependent enzyme [bacterium]